MGLKTLATTAFLSLIILSGISASAQSHGFYVDTVKYPNSNSISVNVRVKSFTNVMAYQGSFKWDKATLQFQSVVGNSVFGLGNYMFNTTNAVSQGLISYSFFDGSLNRHTQPNGTVAFTIYFTVINNPASTYQSNELAFSNTPTPLEIDTADASGIPAAITFPALQNHVNGMVSFARPPVLTYTGGDIKDTITNRPAGCSYQWLRNAVSVSGPVLPVYYSSPSGTFTLKVTYPNGTQVTSLNSVVSTGNEKFIFRGTGNWNTATNWLNNIVAPTTIASGMEVIIDPSIGGQCNSGSITVQNGGSLKVEPGKKLMVTGNVVRQ